MSATWYVRATVVAMAVILALFLALIFFERWAQRRREREVDELPPLTDEEAERLYREATPRPFTEEEVERFIQRTKDGPALLRGVDEGL